MVGAAVFGAGFYYKTFMGPNLFGKNWAWKHLYEPFVRQMAGLGEAPREPDPDAYAQYFDHCDALIVGAGPAGLAAAKALAASGADVILCDEQAELGGSLLAETQATIDGVSAADWLKATIDELTAAKNVRLMPRTQAFGYYAQNFLALGEIVSDAERKANADAPRERLWQVRAKEVVLACGAIERPLVFPDNDRPGVMLADAARTYLNRYGVKVGERVVVAAAHDSAYRAALDLAAAGVKVQRLVDLRDEASGPWPDAARRAGLEIMTGVKLAGTRGKKRVSAVGVESKAGVEWIACDALLMSGGWTPSVHLHSQSRGKLAFDDAREIYVPGEAVQAERSAGACKGTFALADVINEGAARGRGSGARGGLRCAGGASLSDRQCAAGVRRRPRRSKRERLETRARLRRFPERRLRRGHSTRGARGFPLDRACQALHRRRHGDRPGQDLQHERARHRRRGARARR